MNEHDSAQIKEIEKFSLTEDDVLVITVDRDVTQKYVQSLATSLRKNFPKNTIMFLYDSIDIQIYTPKKD